MAKKVVAGLKKGDHRHYAKVIKPVKNEKTGAYNFKEVMMPVEQVKEFMSKK